MGYTAASEGLKEYDKSMCSPMHSVATGQR